MIERTKKTKKTKQTKRNEVPERKKAALERLVNLINEKNTIMIVSIENVSALQLQNIKRILKNKASINIVKRTMIMHALEKAKQTKKGIETLEKWLKGSFAIILSDLDPFELAALLSENKFPAQAKAGQIAPQEIVVEAGITDLAAGPVISELSKLKIKAAIEAGKIAIKETKTIVKKDEEISPDVASVLIKLSIVPFFRSISPLIVYDTKESKIYEKIKVDKEATIQELLASARHAITLALELDYITKETVNILIVKANQNANIILNLIK